MFIISPKEENNVSNPQNLRKQDAPSEESLKRNLASSGYSKAIANKVWKWYNPPELDNNKP